VQIGRGDDFFAVGGHSLLCVQLARRIEAGFGVRLPIARLYESRTLSAMAALVEAGTAAGAETETIVCLREGDGPAILLVHPIGGDVLCYSDIAAAWPGDTRLLAIRHPDVDADRRPDFLSLAAMASRYRADAVRFLGRVPDRVGGWSFGGSVAHEMVRQWEAEDVAPEGLLLIDSPVPDRSYVARARAMLSDLPDLRGAALVDALVDHPRFKALIETEYGIGRLNGLVDAATIDHIMQVHAVNALALAEHRPGQVRTPLAYALARRAENARDLEELQQHLRRLGAGRVEAAAFDEDHFSIIRETAAERVARFLAGALESPPGAEAPPVESLT
jgi:thioesterase domain-containing protein